MTKSTEVEIYGQRYTIKGDADEQYMKRLASYVDEEMRGVAKGLKTATPSKLAVLAALNIAHKLLQAEQLHEKEGADVEQRLLCLMDTIDTLEAKIPATGYR